MKKTFFSLLAVSVVAISILSCNKDTDEDTQPLPAELKISGQLTSNSACKSELKSNSESSATPASSSCVEYAFDSKSNKLTLKHINAGFNCCPEGLSCKIEQKNDTILIQEVEAKAGCKCQCLYDLDIAVNGVSAKKYVIKFIEPYATSQAKIVFEADLTAKPAGSFCVTRSQYPWIAAVE